LSKIASSVLTPSSGASSTKPTTARANALMALSLQASLSNPGF
jgi:hypothetical protein